MSGGHAEGGGRVLTPWAEVALPSLKKGPTVQVEFCSITTLPSSTVSALLTV